MKKSKPYYAIAGKNGYGICRNWDDCRRCMDYFKGVSARKFTSADEAYDWIGDQLSLKVEGDFYFIEELEQILKRKLIFFSKHKLPWEY